MPGDYYVYELVDSRTGEVFYVGKGKGKRDRFHVAEARRFGLSNPAKTLRIRDIESAGFHVIVRRVAEGLDERTAFRQERATIASYGIANLTNISRGQRTENERAVAMANEGLRLMAWHLSQIFRGARYTPLDVKRIFTLIREFREVLSLLNSAG